MTLRISTRRDVGGAVVVIDGRLDFEGAAELERVVADLPGQLCLDLAGLRSMDDEGLAALRSLRARGIAIAQASPYLRLVLGAAPRKTRKPSAPRAGAREGKKAVDGKAPGRSRGRRKR